MKRLGKQNRKAKISGESGREGKRDEIGSNSPGIRNHSNTSLVGIENEDRS